MEIGGYLLSKEVLHKNIYFFKIEVYTRKFGGDFIEKMYWTGYSLDWLTKWRWYFKYRAALLQIKYPRYNVEIYWGKKEAEEKEDEKVIKERQLKKDITTAKRMITKYKNAIKKYEDLESKKLIPNLENPRYLKSLNTLSKYKLKLKTLKEAYSSLKDGELPDNI